MFRFAYVPEEDFTRAVKGQGRQGDKLTCIEFFTDVDNRSRARFKADTFKGLGIVKELLTKSAKAITMSSILSP